MRSQFPIPLQANPGVFKIPEDRQTWIPSHRSIQSQLLAGRLHFGQLDAQWSPNYATWRDKFNLLCPKHVHNNNNNNNKSNKARLLKRTHTDRGRGKQEREQEQATTAAERHVETCSKIPGEISLIYVEFPVQINCQVYRHSDTANGMRYTVYGRGTRQFALLTHN